MTNFVKELSANPALRYEEAVMPGLLRQYESVIIQSIITTFGLDFIIQDKHGGDVDTVYNVNRIGIDKKMTYKNPDNAERYRMNGEYNTTEYHHHDAYIRTNRELTRQKKEGNLVDAYTGRPFAANERTDLDHVVSAKEVHDNRGRVLSGLDGPSLANSPENLKMTNMSTNRSKKAATMEEFIERKGAEYTDAQKKNMLRIDKRSRKLMEAKIARAYYTSTNFGKDLAMAAGNVSVKLGVRQAIGFVFSEIWFSVHAEFKKLNDCNEFSLSKFLNSLAHGIKKGFVSAKNKFSQLFEKFIDGAVAGALSSIVTSLCNVFFTTAKNTVRIIRQVFPSLVEAAKVLFINPECYAFGERMRAVLKVLATGASIVVGVMVNELLAATPASTIPVVGEIIPTFCGAFVTGIMSCTLLYVLDRNEKINQLVSWLNQLPSLEREISFYREQAEYFEAYAAQLMKIDVDGFKRELEKLRNLTDEISDFKSESDLKVKLIQFYEDNKMDFPWKGDFKGSLREHSHRVVYN